jgi:uncharacterized membrane protein
VVMVVVVVADGRATVGERSLNHCTIYVPTIGELTSSRTGLTGSPYLSRGHSQIGQKVHELVNLCAPIPI